MCQFHIESLKKSSSRSQVLLINFPRFLAPALITGNALDVRIYPQCSTKTKHEPCFHSCANLATPKKSVKVWQRQRAAPRELCLPKRGCGRDDRWRRSSWEVTKGNNRHKSQQQLDYKTNRGSLLLRRLLLDATNAKLVHKPTTLYFFDSLGNVRFTA
jgi:hypothetical protein